MPSTDCPTAPPVLSLEICDPRRLIRDALEGPAGWSPKELYLAWLLALPGEIDAAHAAALLLHRITSIARHPAARHLMELLETTTAYPRERLDPAPAGRPRSTEGRLH